MCHFHSWKASSAVSSQDKEEDLPGVSIIKVCREATNMTVKAKYSRPFTNLNFSRPIPCLGWCNFGIIEGHENSACDYQW